MTEKCRNNKHNNNNFVNLLTSVVPTEVTPQM